MIKKLFTQLINWSTKREDFARDSFVAGQEKRSKMDREKNESNEFQKSKKYEANVVIPQETEILGPSDSEINQ